MLLLSSCLIKNIHDLTTFHCIGENNEVFISGKDENGKDITLVFNAFEFIILLMPILTLELIKVLCMIIVPSPILECSEILEEFATIVGI